MRKSAFYSFCSILFCLSFQVSSQNGVVSTLIDLDENGQIDANDIFLFAQQWKQPGTADFDGDGTVGPKDLLLMSSILASPIRFTKPGIINEIQIQIPSQGGAIDIPNIGTITVPVNAVEESFTTTVGQLELNDRDIAAGLSVAVDFKTVTAPYEGSSLQMEFQLNQSYDPGTELEILNVVYASEVGETFTQGLDDLPITTYVGPAIVTDAGDRAVGSIPAPSGKYIIDEPIESIFLLNEETAGKQANPKNVNPAQIQGYELLRAPGTTAGTIPVILVHGIHGEDTAEKNWQGLYQYLDKDPNQFDEWLFIYDTSISFFAPKADKPGKGIHDHADELVNQINSKITGTEPIVLIAHSMGGLVCRDAMQNDTGFTNRIAALLTLGTPHHGSPLAHPKWSQYGFQENHYNIIGDELFEISLNRFFDGRAVFRKSQRNGDLDTAFHYVFQHSWERNALDLIWDNFDESMPLDVEVNKKHSVLLYRKPTLVLPREPEEGNFPVSFNLLKEPDEWYLKDLNKSVTDQVLNKLICYAGIIPESGKSVTSSYSSILLQIGIQIPISLNLKLLFDENEEQLLTRFFSLNSSLLRFLSARLSKFPVADGTENYFDANDGAVPLSSALFLDGNNLDNLPKNIQLADVTNYLNGNTSDTLSSFPARKYRILNNYHHGALMEGDPLLYPKILEDIEKALEDYESEPPDTGGGNNGGGSGPSITVPLPGLPVGATPLEMVYIQPGTFMMGSPNDERSRDSDEGPVHEVEITQGFYMGKYEVTQAQFEAVMGENPAGGYGVGDNHPVYYVPWYDAADFCNRLSEMEGLQPVYTESGSWEANLNANGYRLPTEAEWEYTCRAGTQTRYSHGDALECSDSCGSCELHDQYMWYCGNNSPNGMKEVGKKLPNPWGLYDMHGNSWEWCTDWYASNYYSRSPRQDPVNIQSNQYRVLRGGYCVDSARVCRSADRDWNVPDSMVSVRGFRISRTMAGGNSDSTPTPTPVPPNPTPTPGGEVGETIIVPLNLPPEAKPLEMVYIQSGTFIMGSENGDADEKPLHQVTLTKGFYMGRYEVTQAQYQAVTGKNPSNAYGIGNNYPVYYVSWFDAVRFCNQLSTIEGLQLVYTENGDWEANLNANGFRLPTEAEWEYACRAESNEYFSFRDWCNMNGCDYCKLFDQYMWWCGNWGNQTQEVGLKLPNPWGLYDIHGNVWEWCNDWYGIYPSSPQINPQGPSSGPNRVSRGGGWDRFAWDCRSMNRAYSYTDSRELDNVGFRILKSF